jgi:5'-methylthioadenosine phosphorylase
VDRTWGRPSTFYDGPQAVHVSWADPFCAELRPIAADAARTAGMRVHDRGTVVVIQGPRFSTRAESAHYAQAGWEVINMTQYPEAYLARELEMCYVNMSLITDYDAGPKDTPDATPVSMEEVFRVFAHNLDALRRVLRAIVEGVPAERSCECARALEGTPARDS